MISATQTIFLDLNHLYVDPANEEIMLNMINDSMEKISNAFSGTNIDFVFEVPIDKKFATLDIGNVIINSSDHLGIAHFNENFSAESQGTIRIDNIIDVMHENDLSFDQSTNLISNTIAHEVGHMCGLDHNNDPGDIMHDGLSKNMIDNPPSFYAEQIQSINTNAVVSNLHQVDELQMADDIVQYETIDLDYGITSELHEDTTFDEDSYGEDVSYLG